MQRSAWSYRTSGLLLLVGCVSVWVILMMQPFGAGAAARPLAVQAFQNLALDPLGRVVEVIFDQNLALNAPWDRFRFDIDIVQPLARGGGAFLGDLTGDGVLDLLMVGFNGEVSSFRV